MKEFMTKVSDYISERRNDPEKGGNFMVFCMLGVVALIIIILCLLLLWRRNMGGKENEQAMKAETFTYIPEVRLSEASDEELKQEYLDNIQYMREKVEELLESLTKVKETLGETVISQQEDNIFLQKQVDEITGDIANLVIQLQDTQNHLYDLTDMINVMNNETIPMIQEQIAEIENQMNKVNTDISDIYTKIDMLETTDEELKAKLHEIEKNLRESAEQNMTDVTNRFNDVTNKFNNVDIRLQEIENQVQEKIQTLETKVEERMQELSSWILRYRYEAESNTLYLFPNQ